MTAQEIKKNMTAGEWVARLNDVELDNGEAVAMAYSSGSIKRGVATPAAIATAVNATYGAGIDPACVCYPFTSRKG